MLSNLERPSCPLHGIGTRTNFQLTSGQLALALSSLRKNLLLGKNKVSVIHTLV